MTHIVEEEIPRNLPLPRLPYPINNLKEMFGEEVAILFARKFANMKLTIPECKEARAVYLWNEGHEVSEIAFSLKVDTKVVEGWLKEADKGWLKKDDKPAFVGVDLAR